MAATYDSMSSEMETRVQVNKTPEEVLKDLFTRINFGRWEPGASSVVTYSGEGLVTYNKDSDTYTIGYPHTWAERPDDLKQLARLGLYFQSPFKVGANQLALTSKALLTMNVKQVSDFVNNTPQEQVHNLYTGYLKKELEESIDNGENLPVYFFDRLSSIIFARTVKMDLTVVTKKRGWNILHAAVAANNQDVVNLIKRIVSEQQWNILLSAKTFGSQVTPLDMAITKERPEILLLLGPIPEEIRNKYTSKLKVEMAHDKGEKRSANFFNVALFYIKHDIADPTAVTQQRGWNVLHFAVRSKNIFFIQSVKSSVTEQQWKTLISAKTFASQVTPLDMAKEDRDSEIIQLLSEQYVSPKIEGPSSNPESSPQQLLNLMPDSSLNEKVEIPLNPGKEKFEQLLKAVGLEKIIQCISYDKEKDSFTLDIPDGYPDWDFNIWGEDMTKYKSLLLYFAFLHVSSGSETMTTPKLLEINVEEVVNLVKSETYYADMCRKCTETLKKELERTIDKGEEEPDKFFENVRRLLGIAFKADPTIVSPKKGWNILHVAVRYNNVTFVELLKKSVTAQQWKILLSAKTFASQVTPLDMAKKKGNSEMLNLFHEKSAVNVNETTLKFGCRG